MSESIQNSALPPRPISKTRMEIDGPTYMGLDLAGLDVGDEVVYVIHAEVKEKAVSHSDKDERRIVLTVNNIQDQTPRSDRDLTNRIV